MRFSRCRLLVVLASGSLLLGARTEASAQDHKPLDNAVAESLYAVTIARIADSAIHRLDFFPTRTQVRIQMAFLKDGDSRRVPFRLIRERSIEAGEIVDGMVQSLERVKVPDDLSLLHRMLLSSLRDANRALNELTIAAGVCDASPASVQHCQTPFTSASSSVADAYGRYLDARSKIGAQITDTGTRLAEFKKPPR